MNPDWIRQGARVFEYEHSDSTGDRAHLAVVDRLTDTQILLGNGGRYRRKDLRRVGDRPGGWSPWRELKPLDNPRARTVFARRAFFDLQVAVSGLGHVDLRTEEAILAALAEVETAAVEARRKIEGELTATVARPVARADRGGGQTRT